VAGATPGQGRKCAISRILEGKAVGFAHCHINNKFMKNYYYLFWSDAIQRFIRHKPKEKGWEKKNLTLLSWIFTLAVLSTILWLKYFHVYQSKFGLFGIFITFGEKVPFLLEMGLVFILIYITNYILGSAEKLKSSLKFDFHLWG
jgi:hypothetical protein